MASILLVDRLKEAIEEDLKANREELDKIKQEKKELLDVKDNLCKINKELMGDNSSLTKALKDLKEKYDHLKEKLKRKKDEIQKKDKWWDRYQCTAETMIKSEQKLRTKGSFPCEMLHELQRDLFDLMEEDERKDIGSPQEMGARNPSKLTTSREGKKKVRYTEVSPETPRNNPSWKSHQSKELNLDMACEEESSHKSNGCFRKEVSQTCNNSLTSTDAQGQCVKNPACDHLKTTLITEEEDKDRSKHDKNYLKGKNDLKSNKQGTFSASMKTCPDKNGCEAGMNYNDQDVAYVDSVGYPSLTSTPMVAKFTKNAPLPYKILQDLSIIPKDENGVIPSQSVNIPEAKSYVEDLSLLSLAVPVTYQNLLARNTFSTSKPSFTTAKIKNKEDEICRDSNKLPQVQKDGKYTFTKNLQVCIPDIKKLKKVTQSDGTSPNIPENTEGRGDLKEDRLYINYPVASEENIGSPSILSTDLKPVEIPRSSGVFNEGACMSLKIKASLNGLKRKWSSCEEESEAEKKPEKKTKIKENKQSKEAPGFPEYCSVKLLSDDEENNHLESSSVDLFSDSRKSPSKDLSHEVIDITDEEDDQMQEQKVEQLNNKAEGKNVYLDEDFPGFRKPDKLNYKNIQVVRKKDERAKLDGFSCRECEMYYGEMTESERKKKLKYCSRHRAKYSPPPSTPPGFWNLSFPDTQEYIAGGMMVMGDEVPEQKPRRPKKRRPMKLAQKTAQDWRHGI